MAGSGSQVKHFNKFITGMTEDNDDFTCRHICEKALQVFYKIFSVVEERREVAAWRVMITTES